MAARIAHDRPRRHIGTSPTEELILDAAENLLAEHSLRDLTVARILELAGVSRATFYFYYSSKFAVVAALLTRASDELFIAAQPWVQDRGMASPTTLRESLTTTAAVWERHASVLAASTEQLASDPEIRGLWQGVIDRFVDVFTELIDAERAAGRAPAGVDSRTLAAGLCWGTQRVFYISTIGTDPRLTSPTGVAEMLTAMWMGTIYGSAVPAETGRPRRRQSA